MSDDGLYLLARSEFGDLADGFQNADAIGLLSADDRERVDRARELRGQAYQNGKSAHKSADDFRWVLEQDPTREATRERLVQCLLEELDLHVQIHAWRPIEADKPGVKGDVGVLTFRPGPFRGATAPLQTRTTPTFRCWTIRQACRSRVLHFVGCSAMPVLQFVLISLAS